MKKNLILSFASAAMLSLGWLGLSGIPLLGALVPLLIISDGYDKSRRSFWRAFGWTALSLGIWSGSTTWWIWYAFPPAPFLSVLITVVLFGGMFMLYHWVSKRAPRPLAYTLLAASWIACEYLYMVGEVSFPWLTLGSGFANDIKLIQWYDTTGVFGGSLWVLVSNLLIFHVLRSRPRRAAAWIGPALFIAVPVVISVVKYCTYRQYGDTVKVTIVQPNIDAYDKHLIPQRTQTEIFLEQAAKAPSDVDYIVMPETAIQDQVFENFIEHDNTLDTFRRFLRGHVPGAQIITGASSTRQYPRGEKVSRTAREIRGEWYDFYNTALTVDTTSEVQIYHKSMLLVGVERLPWYDITKHLTFLIVDLGGITGQLGYDDRPTVFTSPAGHRAAAAICWEAVFGEFYSGFVREGAQVMCIISNDGWWEDTQGHRQLFLFSRLRAVESRRAIARSANTGTSGFIDQRGDVLGKLGWDVRDAITETLHTNDKITFYARYGDYIARLCSLVFGLCVLYFIAYRAKKKNKLVE